MNVCVLVEQYIKKRIIIKDNSLMAGCGNGAYKYKE
jgi:hypothetical protein